MTLEEALLFVWRQVLVENANLLQLEGRSYPVRRTARRRLRQVDFEFAGKALRGIEQNPETRSRWAHLAAGGAKVMQFTAAGRYVANVMDGNVTMYGKPAGTAKAHVSGGENSPR
jgi:hypothetical protein